MAGRSLIVNLSARGVCPALPPPDDICASLSTSAAIIHISKKGIALKLRSKPLSASALILAVLIVSACQSDTQQAQAASRPGICRPKAAEALTGKNRVTDAEAMRITGATLVRQIKPGQGVTMDYRQERVTIETDPKTNKILRAMCG